MRRVVIAIILNDYPKSMINIFYSWQTDSPKNTNRFAIRDSINNAISKIQRKNGKIDLRLDEATRNLPGSPSIPASIFDKISNSDIFICDATTINSDVSNEYRKTPNPNVLIELGFAINVLGWSRIIMLFNEDEGKFPDDLPFDIDRHRASPYRIAKEKKKESHNNLTNILEIAINSIIEQNPHKGFGENKLEEVKRERDINTLSKMFKLIHIPTFEHFFDEFPDRIFMDVYDYLSPVTKYVESAEFFLYNNNLLKDIRLFIDRINFCVNYSGNYHISNNPKYAVFQTYLNTFKTDKDEKDFKYLKSQIHETKRLFDEIIIITRGDYPEIDINKLSKKSAK